MDLNNTKPIFSIMVHEPTANTDRFMDQLPLQQQSTTSITALSSTTNSHNESYDSTEAWRVPEGSHTFFFRATAFETEQLRRISGQPFMNHDQPSPRKEAELLRTDPLTGCTDKTKPTKPPKSGTEESQRRKFCVE